jgi:hypothetical protein
MIDVIENKSVNLRRKRCHVIEDFACLVLKRSTKVSEKSDMAKS